MTATNVVTAFADALVDHLAMEIAEKFETEPTVAEAEVALADARKGDTDLTQIYRESVEPTDIVEAWKLLQTPAEQERVWKKRYA